MEDKDVVVLLRDEYESWETTFLITEEDAFRIVNLQWIRPGTRIEVPSIDGFAEVRHDKLELVYRSKTSGSQRIISVPFPFARDALARAISVAAEQRRSALAWQQIWDWVNEHHDGAQVLTLAEGERVSATILHNKNEYVAIERADGSVAIADVMSENEMPVGTRVVLALDEGGSIVISER